MPLFLEDSDDDSDDGEDGVSEEVAIIVVLSAILFANIGIMAWCTYRLCRKRALSSRTSQAPQRQIHLKASRPGGLRVVIGGVDERSKQITPTSDVSWWTLSSGGHGSSQQSRGKTQARSPGDNQDTQSTTTGLSQSAPTLASAQTHGSRRMLGLLQV